MTAMTTERRRWTSISDLLLVRVQGDQNQVDEFDEDERHDDAADTVNPDVAPQDRRRTGRAELNAPQGQGDQRDDHQSVEYDGREHGALGTVQVHDIECFERSVVSKDIGAREQGANDGEVLG